jgi:hypothetical protein
MDYYWYSDVVTLNGRGKATTNRSLRLTDGRFGDVLWIATWCLFVVAFGAIDGLLSLPPAF